MPCLDCGCVRLVRKDTNPKLCRKCSATRGGKIKKGLYADRKPCAYCKKPILVSSGDTYCSKECRSEANTESRACKFCGVTFKVLKSTISDATNASGNFCSLGHYHLWLRGGVLSVPRNQSVQKRVSRAALKRQPFCAICGTTRNMEVHHIVPYRLTQDDSPENQMPLCKKHHKIVETLTHDLEMHVDNPEQIAEIMTPLLQGSAEILLTFASNLIQ